MSENTSARWLPREKWLPQIMESSEVLSSNLSRPYYRARNNIHIFTSKGPFLISTVDQFDLADAQCIRVMKEGFEFSIPWGVVSRVQIRD